MTQSPASPNKQFPSGHSDDQHTPLLAMWYQTRTALADFMIPVLAGLKVVWLIVLSPTRFFRAYLYGTKELAALRSPFDIFWRTLTSEERVPLDAAKFLLFSILTAALAGFSFDNTNRLSGLVTQSGVRDRGLTILSQQIPGLASVIERLILFWQNDTVQAIQAFFDQDLVAAIIELVATLIITMLFAYLFRLIAGRYVSATGSYAFWLYMTGMQFFTTAITFVFFKIVSLPAFDLPQFTPQAIFLILENGWLIIWLYLMPLFILPRIFPPLTLRRTLLSLLITHGAFIALDWLLGIGFATVILFLSSVLNLF